MQIMQNRRRFLASASLAGAAGILGTSKSLRADGPPETTTVRIVKWPGPTVCEAPKYVAKELLHAEGITNVVYVEDPATEGLDFDLGFATSWVSWTDAAPPDDPWTTLAGLHAGCLQMIANESIQTVQDLKGKRVGVDDLSTSSGYLLTTLMAAYVGLDPKKDIEWVTNEDSTLVDLFAGGKIDAFLAPPPDPQEVLARKIGHSILNTTFDAPWSQYYCCMMGASNDYLAKYPIATKRVLRSFLKAADICKSQPAVAVRSLIDNGITDKYDYSLQGLSEIPYGTWREFDPEDTIRFYALRLQELGFIKSTPEQIIANGTNWTLLNEIKRELKG
jgi:NitT/TauT family transport system substrate-binding protein